MPPKEYYYEYFTSPYYNDYVHKWSSADRPFYYESPRLKKDKRRYSHGHSDRLFYHQETQSRAHQTTRSPQTAAKATKVPYVHSWPSADSPFHDEWHHGSPRLKRDKQRHSYDKPRSDRFFYYQETNDQQSTQSRARQTPQTAVKATEEDAARAGIPTGYSIKNWDPVEKPIVLLGSIFDANSLGKWIYDWTVYHHGPSTPMADVAGDFWLLLIKLAGKIKRAEDCVERIGSIDSQEMVDDFIDSGNRLWQKFKELLKACEQYMWRAARREGSKGVSMGKNAGTEFVDSIFGRDRELENTEKLRNSMRLWNLRFDANCEEIIKNPRHGVFM